MLKAPTPVAVEAVGGDGGPGERRRSAGQGRVVEGDLGRRKQQGGDRPAGPERLDPGGEEKPHQGEDLLVLGPERLPRHAAEENVTRGFSSHGEPRAQQPVQRHRGALQGPAQAIQRLEVRHQEARGLAESGRDLPERSGRVGPGPPAPGNRAGQRHQGSGNLAGRQDFQAVVRDQLVEAAAGAAHQVGAVDRLAGDPGQVFGYRFAG